MDGGRIFVEDDVEIRGEEDVERGNYFQYTF